MRKVSSILLVDDDETTNFVNQILLEDIKVADQILTATNGEEALVLIKSQCAERGCPTLVLLDINMPVMNGFEFLAAYDKLEMDNKQSVVVVMLTTSLNPNDLKRLDDLPNQGFLNKPLTAKMVDQVLETYFGQDNQPNH
ncbi:MAG: response regulator [Tunicatimonas sp.]